MTRRKYVLHDYGSDQGRLYIGQINRKRQGSKDKSLKNRATVSNVFTYSVIVIIKQLNIPLYGKKMTKSEGIMYSCVQREDFQYDIIYEHI